MSYLLEIWQVLEQSAVPDSFFWLEHSAYWLACRYPGTGAEVCTEVPYTKFENTLCTRDYLDY